MGLVFMHLLLVVVWWVGLVLCCFWVCFDYLVLVMML